MPNSSHFAMQAAIRGIVCAAICALTLSACSAAVTKDTSTQSLLPNLPDYNVSDTTNIQDAIAKVAGGSALVAGQPEAVALIAGVNSLVSCYQKAGAIEGRTYVNKSDPTTAGVLIIVNKNALTDPQTIISCVAPKGAGAQSIMIQPCAKAYTLNKDNNQFYIAYAGTNDKICSAFCSNLQGCQ